MATVMIRSLAVAACAGLTLAACGGNTDKTAAPAASVSRATTATAPTSVQSTPSPTPTFCPNGWLPNGNCAGGTTAAATTVGATPVRTPGDTCSNSSAWEQQGGTELIDGYINNQDSGNIDVEDIKVFCPQYLPVWQRSRGGIPGGSSFAVPAEVKPGTYETTSSDLENCYWERSRKGEIVDNRFITASKVKQRVTIRSTDDTFVNKGCGNWVKVA